MFVRDMQTGTMLPGQNAFLGNAEEDAAYLDTGNDPLLNQIRAISVPMGQLRARVDAAIANVGNADVDVNTDQLSSDIQQLAVYQSQLANAVQAFKSSPAYVADSATAHELDNWLSFSMDWAGSTLAMIPQVLVDTTGTITNTLADMASGAGVAAIRGLLPFGVMALGILYLVTRAEKSRTYTRYVA